MLFSDAVTASSQRKERRPDCLPPHQNPKYSSKLPNCLITGYVDTTSQADECSTLSYKWDWVLKKVDPVEGSNKSV